MFNVSTAYQTAIKQPSRTIKASIGIGDTTATNRVGNGNFATGTTGWTGYSCTISANPTTNECIAIATSQYGGFARNVVCVIGNKYYFRALIKADSTSVNLKFMDGASYNTVNVTTVGAYKVVSGYATIVNATNITFKIQDDRASGWTNTYVKECFAIDLTATYGVGNEPTKTYMDELFSKVGWFDTTETIPTRFFDDRILYNRVLNGNFNGTTSWTQASCTATATGNVATVTMTSQYGEFRQFNTTYYIEGHKYYSRAEVQANSNLVSLRVSRGVGFAQAIASHSGSGEYETLSGIITLNSPVTNGFTSIMDTRASGWSSILVKNVVTLDLTALYGAGNEPTKAYMDTLVNTLGWFNTATVTPTTTGEATIIQDFNVESSFGSNNMPTIGGVFSNKLSASLINESRIPQVLIDTTLRPYTAIDIGSGVYEWVRHGEFYADYSDVIKTDKIIKLESYDAMSIYDTLAFQSTLTYPAKFEDIITEMTSVYGVKFTPRSLYGKNLCVTQFQDWESGQYDNLTGAKTESTSRIRLGGGYVAVTPNTTYYCNTFNTTAKTVRFVLRAYDGSEVFTRSIGVVNDMATFTTGATEYWISVTLYETTDTVDFAFWQSAFELNQVKPFICLNSETDKTFDIFLPHIRFDTEPVATLRQTLSLMASQMAHNCTINDSGDIDFRFLTPSGFGFNADNYIDFKLTSDAIINITELIVPQGDNPLIAGNETGFAISFENSQITSGTELLQIYDINFPLSYYSYTMKAQGMPHLQIGDTVQFTDKLGIVRTLIIVNHKFNFNGGMTSEFKVDAPKRTTTEVTTTAGSTVTQSIKRSYDTLIEAMNSATQLITGNMGGSVITVMDETSGMPKELVICDTGDINTATNVWRWNLNGLGFSSTGYNGTYALAITADGKFVADFITTGTLNADLIKAGTLKSFNEKSWIDMDNGTFSFGDGKLIWDGTTFTINYDGSSLGTALSKKLNTTDVDTLGLRTYMKFDNGILLGEQNSPLQVSITNKSMQFLDNGGTLFQNMSTALSGTGSVATATFQTQTIVPYPVGSKITITDAVPSGYNGTFTVTGATTSTVSWASTTTGSQTTAGKIVSVFEPNANAVAYINGQKMYITDLEATSSLVVGVHKIEKYDSNTTLIKWIG